MKIKGITGLRVGICAGGFDLQEFDAAVDTNDDPSKAIKYVEASSGLNFMIHVRVRRSGSRRLPSPHRADALQCGVILDGRKVTSKTLRIKHDRNDYREFIDGVTENHDGKFLRRPFQFADLTTIDDGGDTCNVQTMENLGEIQLEFQWCRVGKIVPARRAKPGVRSSGRNEIPEKSLKGRAISSQAILGAGKPCTGRSRLETTFPYGKQPFATHVFRYRSQRDLQFEGIIPRSPAPEPGISLEERDPATLSAEEARELIRILRERHGGRIQVKDETRPEIKYEGVKRASSQITGLEDNDDLMVLGEGCRSKRARRATDEVVDCIDLTDT